MCSESEDTLCILFNSTACYSHKASVTGVVLISTKLS